jgi:hypothetical protein
VIRKALLNSGGAGALLIQSDLTAVRFSLMLTCFDQEKDYLILAKVGLLTTLG